MSSQVSHPVEISLFPHRAQITFGRLSSERQDFCPEQLSGSGYGGSIGEVLGDETVMEITAMYREVLETGKPDSFTASVPLNNAEWTRLCFDLKLWGAIYTGSAPRLG